jgi:hypothetical protein
MVGPQGAGRRFDPIQLFNQGRNQMPLHFAWL